MKLLKLVVSVLFFLAIGANVSLAQTAIGKAPEVQKEEIQASLEDYFAALDLSDEQKVQFEAITKKYSEKMGALKQSEESGLDKMKALKSIKADKNAEIKQILSEDQYAIYLEKQEERHTKIKAKKEMPQG